ncbi:MAG: superoxide dismutase family protein [Thermodesulfobacteriota bacterium]
MARATRWSILLTVLAFASPAVSQQAGGDAARIPATEGGTQKGTAGDAGQGKEMAHAQLSDAKGGKVGWVRIRETPHGLILHTRLSGLPPGEHAFHVHEVGKCEPPFESAGAHYNPGKDAHGFAVADGYHAGDLPNVTIPRDGALEVDLFAVGLTVSQGDRTLLDEDGSALIVHEGIDDYASQPSGNAGKRIACGVVKQGAMSGGTGEGS